MASRHTPPASGVEKWSTDATVYLLAYLNVHLNEFRADADDALGKLVKSISRDLSCTKTVRQVETKLKDIWRSAGREDAKKYNELYDTGISYHTLPGFRDFDMQFQYSFAAKVELLREQEKTKCTCPFDIDDTQRSVQCQSCLYWQHVYCFYDNDDVPGIHLCTDCRRKTLVHGDFSIQSHNKEEDVASSLEQLNLQSSLQTAGEGHTTDDLESIIRKLQEEKHSQKRSFENLKKELGYCKVFVARQKHLGTFTTFGSERDVDESFKGPTNAEIRSQFRFLHSELRKVVMGIENGTKDFSLKTLPCPDQLDSDLSHLLWVCFGRRSSDLHKVEDRSLLSSIDLELLLRSLATAALCDWVFCGDSFERIQPRSPLFEELIRSILYMDGERAAANAQAAAWSVVSKPGAESFQKMVTEEAETIANRISQLLNTVLSPSDQAGPRGSVLYWGKSKEDWQYRLRVLEDIVRRSLVLKARLFLRQTPFEVYLPKFAEVFDEVKMEPEVLPAVRTRKTGKILLCTMPAIVSRQTFEDQEPKVNGRLLSFGDHLCWSLKDFNEKDVIAEAKVLLCL